MLPWIISGFVCSNTDCQHHFVTDKIQKQSESILMSQANDDQEKETIEDVLVDIPDQNKKVKVKLKKRGKNNVEAEFPDGQNVKYQNGIMILPDGRTIDFNSKIDKSGQKLKLEKLMKIKEQKDKEWKGQDEPK